MKNKYFILLIIVMCCTGCHADYHLNIDNVDSIKEDILLNVTSDNDKVKFDKFDYYVPINFDADDISVFQSRLKNINYYNISKREDSLRFQYRKFTSNQLSNGMFVKSCYQYVTVMDQDNDKELLLSTSREFLCFDKYDNLDDVTVTITSKYKLKETNADEVSRHTYRWFINKGNAKDKYLYLLLNTGEKDLNLWERILEGDFTNTFTIFLAVFLIGGIIIFLFKKKGDRRNRV